jgi:hypothetical protein
MARSCFRALTTCVYRSFRAVERQADKVTRFVGPIFLGVAVVLISISAFTFFEVRSSSPSFASVELNPASSQAVYPEVFLGPETGWVSCIVGTAWSLYLISMFSFHVRSFPSSSPFRQFTPSTPRIVLYVGHHTPRHTSRP